jgi:hypothetical protein
MGAGVRGAEMSYDVCKTEKPEPSGNVVVFERLAGLTKHQSALSKYLQLLRAAKAGKV